MKQCTKCKRILAVTDFYKDPRLLDGLQSNCRYCFKERHHRYYQKNKEPLKLQARTYYQDHKEQMHAATRARYARNPMPFKKTRQRWEAQNRDKTRARWQKHEAAKSNAIPSWADFKKISAIYSDASEREKSTGESHHVDHIVPLQSDIVCGLHCEDNLQILTASENTAKGNRTWPDMP